MILSFQGNTFIEISEMVDRNQFKILVIDGDGFQAEETCAVLRAEGYRVLHANNGQEGIDLINREMPQMVITELVLDASDGIEICHYLRENERFQNTVVAVLTERKENYSQIAAYDAGVDDYLIKPVTPHLFRSKIRSLLRRYKTMNYVDQIEVDGVKIDLEKFLIIKGNTEISVPRKEFEILSLLVSRPKKVFSRAEIKDEVWGGDGQVRYRTIDVHIRKLREKIGDSLIKTVKGVGYKIEV